MTTTDTPAEVVRRLYAAMADGDAATLDAVLADEVTITVPGRGINAGTHAGKPAVFAFLGRTQELTGGSMRFEPSAVLDDEQGNVVALARYRASRPDREPLVHELAQSFAVRDGRIVESRFYSASQYEADVFWS